MIDQYGADLEVWRIDHSDIGMGGINGNGQGLAAKACWVHDLGPVVLDPIALIKAICRLKTRNHLIDAGRAIDGQGRLNGAAAPVLQHQTA